ncbi:MAG: ABC transporter permease, partial [Planctomycetaceae bacterium]|nr:ABC transporter permease [Planctomycetaceae bacterium]
MKFSHPILAITTARLREFVRRPEAVFWVYFFPVLMVVVLGVAFRNKPVEVFQVDIVAGPESDLIFEWLESDEQLQPTIVSREEALDRLRLSKTTLMITAIDGQADNIEYQYDPVRPGSVASRNIVDRKLQTENGREDVIESNDVTFSEPGNSYVDFLVPGLLAMGLMGGGLWGVGYAIVDMRIRKLLKRLMATPMRRTHFLIAMMTSRLVFMIPQIILLIVFSYFLFGVEVHGNWFSILLIIILGAIEFAAIGLLVASRANTMETASGLMNLVMLPMWTLSGIFFSYERFPE